MRLNIPGTARNSEEFEVMSPAQSFGRRWREPTFAHRSSPDFNQGARVGFVLKNDLT